MDSHRLAITMRNFRRQHISSWAKRRFLPMIFVIFGEGNRFLGFQDRYFHFSGFRVFHDKMMNIFTGMLCRVPRGTAHEQGHLIANPRRNG
jgi:hypothetical protein